MTLSEFRAQFPEFQNVPDALCNSMLTAALGEINVEIWGTLKDQGQGYLAAHKLALSPYGNAARLVAKDGTTTYGNHYRDLIMTVSEGAMTL